jgi:hypothetical protein
MWGSGCIDPHFLDLGTSWRWVVSFTPRPPYPQEKSPLYPLDRRLGGPHSWSGRHGEVKILASTRTRIPTPWSSAHSQSLYRLHNPGSTVRMGGYQNYCSICTYYKFWIIMVLYVMEMVQICYLWLFFHCLLPFLWLTYVLCSRPIVADPLVIFCLLLSCVSI